MKKHILALQTMSRAEIETILETADSMSEILARRVKKVPTLRGRAMVTLFYENSTRTRTSFEMAAKIMSAEAINIAVAQSSAAKGESLRDTILTLGALRADCVVIRHGNSGAAELAAKWCDIAVVNAGDGWHEHPTQGLLDLWTMRAHKKKIDGLNVAIIARISPILPPSGGGRRSGSRGLRLPSGGPPVPRGPRPTRPASRAASCEEFSTPVACDTRPRAWVSLMAGRDFQGENSATICRACFLESALGPLKRAAPSMRRGRRPLAERIIGPPPGGRPSAGPPKGGRGGWAIAIPEPQTHRPAIAKRRNVLTLPVNPARLRLRLRAA